MTEPNQTPGAKDALNKAEDAVGAAVGMASATTAGAHSAKAFAQNAVAANLYELEAARLALSRAQSEGVLDLARQMIEDHELIGERMQTALEACGLAGETPRKLDNRRQGMIDNLVEAPDDSFDRRYLEQQEAAHKEAVALFKGFAEHGDEADLKRLAAEIAPTLESHLEQVKAARGH